MFFQYILFHINKPQEYKSINTKIGSLLKFQKANLLFHISFYESNIYEIPIKTIYFGKSSLSPIKTIIPFLIKHLKNLIIRIFYEFTK